MSALETPVDVLFRRLHPDAELPSYAHPGDAGADLRCLEAFTLAPGERRLVGTGLALGLPEGYAGFVHPRSGLAARFGVTVLNAPGTVDAGYRGEIMVCLLNTDRDRAVAFAAGDRIAQLVVTAVRRAEFVVVDELPESARGLAVTGRPGNTGPVIFRRNKKQADEAEDTDLVAGAEAADEDSDLQDPDAEGSDAEGSDAEEAELDVEALDAAEWRSEGPFDISEVDDLEGTPEAPRIDLGAMIITGFPGAELRLQMSEETQQIVSAMLLHADSALEVGAYAAPRSGGLWSELREEIMASAVEVGGSAALAEGPFGVELRRFIPVTTPDGEQGYQPSRMWVAEGPRWLLRGIIYGQAALEDGVEPPADQLLEAFRQIVIRRGDEAMAPGDLLPLTMPQNLVEEPADDDEDDAVS